MKTISKLLVVVCFLGFVDAKAVQPPSVSLFEAAAFGYTDAVEQHIKAKSFINDRDSFGATPMHYAAQFNRVKVIALLANNGGNITAKDKKGLTPLHYACGTIAFDSVKKFTDLNIDTSITCNSGKTAISYVFNSNKFTEYSSKLIAEQSTYVHKNLFTRLADTIELLLNHMKATNITIHSGEINSNRFRPIIQSLTPKDKLLENFKSRFRFELPDSYSGFSLFGFPQKKQYGDLDILTTKQNQLIEKYEAEELAKKEADARQAEARRQTALRRSLNNLDSKLSGRTSVNVPQARYAPANYESLIRRKYIDATIHPGTISGNPVVKVQLVIARNGTVISARIIGTSGLASWDRAVQKALDRVKRIAPFPAGMSGTKKTFNLNFNSRSFQ